MPRGHKGEPKTPGSGRKKGTRNKESIPLWEKAKELGIDPFEVLLHFTNGNWKQLGYPGPTETKYLRDGTSYESPIITPDMRLRASSEACQYIHPKLKAIEHTGNNTHGNQSTVIILPSNGREVKK